MSEDITFEEQLRLEALEEEQKVNQKTRIDEDGTEYEWDEKKRAWFPKVSSFILFLKCIQVYANIFLIAHKSYQYNSINCISTLNSYFVKLVVVVLL